ncbi:L-cysteine desulfhydrase-like [Gigantopelta aegis]|uniref:L-cysteine desulfhydrase-like n=1 Tax=Gigantopelta aegis TaxID=1735272 RepID=UPI001B88E692|nr:L-cysteine desulfhydrase-like [Gigantopelta aegis]
MHKRDFGSFHSSNVQELISIANERYLPPELPFKLRYDSTADSHSKTIQFGREFKDRYFLLEDTCTFLNHGAFGAVLRPALEDAQKWQVYTEKQPLRFYDRELLPHLVYVTRRLANFVDCDPCDIVLVSNATTGINAVLKSLKFSSGDVIFTLSVTYGAVKKLLKQVCTETGAVVKEATVTFPLSGPDQLTKLVREELEPNVTKLAVFDHIPSNTPFILPLKEIIDICHEKNIPVLVDGAHALGSISLRLKNLKPDFYVSNAHKWFCGPKGAAFLYVDKTFQSVIRPVVISHGFGSGYNSEFIWTGLHDYSPFLALHTVLDFWQMLGVGVIQGYMHDLCRQAGGMLAKSWGTALAAPQDMFGSMSLVRLPSSLFDNDDLVNYSKAEEIQNKLYHNYNIEVPIKCIENKLYVRISCHVYNSLGEYKKLADAVSEMCT